MHGERSARLPRDPADNAGSGQHGVSLFVFINHYTDLARFQTAFVWPAWIADPDMEPSIALGCHRVCAYGHEPLNPGGPTHGALSMAFDCFLNNGLPASIARIDFLAGAGGCLTQMNPTLGTQRVEVLNCQNRSTLIDASDPVLGQPRLGTICVGRSGRDACDPGATPIEAGTWGKVKASYR